MTFSTVIALLVIASVSQAATPVAWFKSDAITGISNGGAVQTWFDATGNGFNAVQSTSAQCPTYVTNAMGGLPVVRFSSSSSTSLAFTRPVQDDFTILCVFQSTQGLNSGTLYYEGAGLVNAEVGGVVNDFGSCLFANGSICAGSGSPDVAVSSSAGYNDGRPHVFALQRTRSTGLVALYVDGVLAGTTTGGTQSLTSPSRVVIGAQQTSIYFLSGDISEILVYSNVLASTELQTAQSPLFLKYQISPAVPIGLFLQPQGGHFNLNWLSAAGASGYYVKRSTTQAGPFAPIATNSTTSFTDALASSTNLYFYAVSAFNAAGESSNSIPVGTEALLNPHDLLGPSSRTTPIAISEIMYKPATRADGKNLEFIEIYNSNPWFHDISGYQLTCADVSYTFPQGTTIGANRFIVVAAVPGDITSVYGIANVMGPYTGSLKKAETLQLLDEQGSVLLSVPYTSAFPWPVAALGTGHSIVLAYPTYGEGDPRAWDISDATGGSPGQAETFHPSSLRNVVINEILPHSENASVPQFIELYNHSSGSVDVSGCILTDDPGTNRFILPSGTQIGPGGFVSFANSAFGFSLNGAGGALYLIQPDGTRVLDAVQYGAQSDGVSFGRWPDGASDFYAFASRTPGTNNSPILIGDIVINELMYDPISGNDDDQYIELYNKGANAVNMAGWQFTSGVTFTFPSVTIAANGYLVVARNIANALANHPNLSSANTVGNFGGKLSHSGELVVLSMPQTLNTNTTILVAEDQVAYGTGGRWGQWAGGGGSSLELIDPRSDHRLASNWADSDESQKSSWTNIEFTGTLDNGYNYNGSTIVNAQVGILDVGECLVDNLEVLDTTGSNYVSNPSFESGLGNWIFQGDQIRSSLESSGYSSSYSLHIRCSDRYYNGDNSCQVSLNANSLASGQTATMRFKARWIHGWPEVAFRLNGGWIEAVGQLSVPVNLGSPGASNTRKSTNAGPGIYRVTHFPSAPAANQPAVVTARVHDPDGVRNLALNYRVDPSTSYTSVALNDAGTNGDSVAGDGVFSATLPAQPVGTLVAYYISATDSNSVASRFPALLSDNTPVRECLVLFGDGSPGGNFCAYHLWITQTNVTRWANLGNLSNEGNDCTMVNGNRVIYNAQARFAGSPVHQYYDTPAGTLCSYKWIFNDDDKFLGATSFNKIHVPGNTDNDPTIQREQLANTFLRALGVPWLNRRYVVVYVNGNRRGPLMEDAQTPDGDVVKEHYPNDSGGYLYKVARWYEFTPSTTGYSLADTMVSEAMLMPYTTTGGGKKVARYRWNWECRRTADSANNYSSLFSLIDAASSHGSPNYAKNMNNLADMENWMRVFAANHAAGNWDCFGSTSGQNLYAYSGTLGTKWSLLMFDFNIGLGIDNSFEPGQSLFATLSGDSNVAGVYSEPAFRRMYWRALNELVTNGPLNLSLSVPLLNAKYSVFAANGLDVEDPNANLIPWITQASPVVAAQVSAANAAAFSVNLTLVTNNVAYISGVAPFNVDSVEINGVTYPLTWLTVTNWVITVPLISGTNLLSIVGVDRLSQPILGASNGVSVVYSGTNASPVGHVVINEIMYAPALANAQYIELYNNSTNQAFDLSGWQLQGASYTFPAGSMIAPTNYLILARNAAAFAAAYGTTNPVFDTFSTTLLTNGTLSLITSSNLTVAKVKYENQLPWPTNATGTGAAIQLIDSTRDNWRVGNWAAVLSNAPVVPQWTYVAATGTATASLLYIYMQSAGDVYIDDIKLVAGSVAEAGANTLADGDFESGFTNYWTPSKNLTNSTLSTMIKHSGNASLHVISTASGSSLSSSIWQSISPVLTTNAAYTLSFWYLQNTNGGPLTFRLSSSGIITSVNPAPPASTPVSATPDLANSVLASVTPFPSLWINELQSDNLNGITNRAGQHTPWLELYNPGTNAVSLNGLYLANNYTNLLQWGFPTNAVINARQFKVIFADALTNLSTTIELHTSFALSSGGGSVALTRLGGNGQFQVLDYVNYANITANDSYGSFPDGQSFVRQEFYVATPGGTNNGTTTQPPSFIRYSVAGMPYTQNFDSLPNPGAASVNTANPVSINGVTYSLCNPFDFAFPVASSGSGGLGLTDMAGWYGTGVLNSKFGATDGDQTTGGEISFGLPSGSNRALGLLATSTTGATAFGARLINASTNILTRFTLQCTGELWRQSTVSKTLQFFYAIDSSGTSSFPASVTAFIPALNVRMATSASASGGVAVDGTAALNQTNLSVIDQPMTNWVPGAALWLVWQMADSTGKAQGLGIDNLQFSANILPAQPVPLHFATSGTNFILNWPTYSGQTYQLEYKDDLSVATWTPMGSPVAGTGGDLVFTNGLGASSKRFYRLTVAP